MNSREVKNFIADHSSLFGWIKESKKENISHELLVELILSYGDVKNIKKLFELLGIKEVSEIFYRQISRKRVNYHKKTVNYFKLYFERNV